MPRSYDNIIPHPAAISASHSLQRHIHPPARRIAFPRSKLYEIVPAHARQKDHLRRRVALVHLEVEINADAHHGDKFEEM